MLSPEKGRLRGTGGLRGGQSQGRQQGGQWTSICNILVPHQILPSTSAKKLQGQTAVPEQKPQQPPSREQKAQAVLTAGKHRQPVPCLASPRLGACPGCREEKQMSPGVQGLPPAASSPA